MTTWSNDKILLFINSVYLRPELWDVEDSSYKNRDLKKDSWLSIAKEYCITRQEAYKKFKNLRTYIKNEQKKMHRNGGSGGGKIGKWFAYDALSFILSRDVPETSVDSEKPETETLEGSEYLEVESMVPVVVQTTSSQRKRKCTYNSGEQIALEKAMNIINDTSRERKNPHSAFGEHVANKLLTYDNYTRSQVEFKISQILFEADMQQLKATTNDVEEGSNDI